MADWAEQLGRRYHDAKSALGDWVRSLHLDTVVAQAHALSPDGIVTDLELVAATEWVLFEHSTSWSVEAFLATAAAAALDDEQRSWIAAWHADPVDGVFEVLGVSGEVLETRNLVDGLEYRVLFPQAGPSHGRAGFVASRALPISGGLHVFSGVMEGLGDERRYAMGRAARVASEHPAQYYRGPAHRELGLQVRGLEHACFVECFGRPWLLGEPVEVDTLLRRFWLEVRDTPESVALRGPLSADERAHLERGPMLPPEALARAEFGVVSTAQIGVKGFGALSVLVIGLTSGRKPSRSESRALREMLALREVEPELWVTIGDTESSAATVAMRALLGEPRFEWARDIEAVLRRYKPWAYERPRPAGLTVLTEPLREALAWLERYEEEGPPSRTKREPQRRGRADKKRKKKKRR